MSLRVVVEDLAASASAVTGSAEDLAVAHAAADGRMDAAQSGWQGRSAVALGLVVSRWVDEGRALVSRMVEHAEALQECARRFWAQDDEGADALNQSSRPTPFPEE